MPCSYLYEKGKGYAPAEDNSGEYHGLPPKKDDDNNCKGECFTDAFGKALLSFADKDNSIYAVTAAMKYGTGLQHFYKAFPERFFDVGIAEQHAVTFSAGLASQGKLPVFAVYSSFLQRSYDQLIHDCAIEKRHIVLGIDRAGFVGEDGETHHGLFDVAMLTTVPGVTVYSPSDTAELSQCLEQALYKDKGIVAVRYPRGCELYRSGTKAYSDFRHVSNKSRKLIFTYGRISAYAYTIHGVDILQAIKIFPIVDEIIDICLTYDEIYAFEEGEREGGIAQKLCTALALAGFKGRFTITAVDGFVRHANVAAQLHNAMLDADGMRKKLQENKMQKRLDVYLSENNTVKSRSLAASLIKQGSVEVNGRICTKASFAVDDNDNIRIIGDAKICRQRRIKARKGIIPLQTSS